MVVVPPGGSCSSGELCSGGAICHRVSLVVSIGRAELLLSHGVYVQIR